MGLGLDRPGTAPLRRCASGVLACIRYAVGILRATAFWGTILLPFVIVGSLAADVATSAPIRVASLVGLNVLCILLGRGYRPND